MITLSTHLALALSGLRRPFRVVEYNVSGGDTLAIVITADGVGVFVPHGPGDVQEIIAHIIKSAHSVS